MNHELVKEGQDMNLYVKALKETLVKKNEDYKTAENKFHSNRAELQQQLDLLQVQVVTYQRQLKSMTEVTADGEIEFHNERREFQQQLASLHGRVDVYQRQCTELQKQVREYQRQEVLFCEQREGYQRMQSETDDKIKQLQEQLKKYGGQSTASATTTQQYPDNLEKEMQERLSKR